MTDSGSVASSLGRLVGLLVLPLLIALVVYGVRRARGKADLRAPALWFAGAFVVGLLLSALGRQQTG